MPETLPPTRVRAFPSPEGWWWYDLWDEATDAWTGRMRRADMIDVLVDRGYRVSTATNRLRLARDAYDAWRSADRRRRSADSAPG